MLASLLGSLALLAARATATILYAGVDESGGEFGVYGVKGQGLPGRFNVDYAFLNASTVPIWVKQNGINVFRVAFLLERLCPLEYGLGARFNETYFSEYATAINAITSAGAYALLDPHNYMRYNDPSSQPFSGSIIGDTTDPAAATTAQFGKFWAALAARFVHNERVIFGLMNEPHDMSTALILQNNQAAVNGIRGVGAHQLILAPGNGWTGGHTWTVSAGGDPSSDYLYKLHDPIKNTALDIHEYLDYDYSGSHQVCNQTFASNLAPLTAWLKKYNLKGFVSEFGGANTTSCDTLVPAALEYLAENPEYIGWSAWAAGPFWGENAPCCGDGALLGSLEPNSVAAGGGPSLYETVWLKLIQPFVPHHTLKRSGISSIHA